MGWLPYVVAGGASLIGGYMASQGSQNAAQTQANAANQAAQLQYQEFEQEQQNLAPYRAGGYEAYNKMLQLEGLGPVSSGTSSAGAGSSVGHRSPSRANASVGPRGANYSLGAPGVGMPGLLNPFPTTAESAPLREMPGSIPIARYAMGGAFPAGARIMTGEAGPEAIYNQRGRLAQLVTRPTVGTTTQPGTVVPLSSTLANAHSTALNAPAPAPSLGGVNQNTSRTGTGADPSSMGATQSGSGSTTLVPLALGGAIPLPSSMLTSQNTSSGSSQQGASGGTEVSLGPGLGVAMFPAGTFPSGSQNGGQSQSGSAANPDGSLTVSANGTTWQTDPGYQFRLQQGQQAIDNGLLARGLGLSGAEAKATMRYNQDFASNEYANAYNRLAQIAGFGSSATSQVNALGQAMAGNVGNLYMNAGNAGAMGQIGSANAWSNTMNNLAGIYGMYMANSGG